MSCRQFHQDFTRELFCTKVQLFSRYILALLSFGAKILVQKALVKCCWNRHLEALRKSNTNYTLLLKNIFSSSATKLRIENPCESDICCRDRGNNWFKFHFFKSFLFLLSDPSPHWNKEISCNILANLHIFL